jgi:invasion protein IalB
MRMPLLLLALLPAPVLAEPPAIGAAFGAWRLGCEAVAVGETLCYLAQQLARADTGALLVELLALPDADPAVTVIARVPLGVHFPSGLVAGDAGGAEVAFVWQSCNSRLCEALLQLDPETLARLEAAPALRLAYRPEATAPPLVFGASFAGLAEGVAALRAAAVPQP